MGTSCSKLSGKLDEMLGVTCDGLASHPGAVTILLVAKETGISSGGVGHYARVQNFTFFQPSQE